MLPPGYAGDADATLASVRLTDARVEQGGLLIELSMSAPDAPAGAAQTEPPLDLKEIEQWDAFLTFVVKQAALDVADEQLRSALLGTLLDARYDIVKVLMTAKAGDADPVPALFRKAWDRLTPGGLGAESQSTRCEVEVCCAEERTG